jgi:hypothetical protein
MTWYDVDIKKPDKPGLYELESSRNKYAIAYWNGEDWFIHWLGIYGPFWPQSWSDREITDLATYKYKQ